MSSKGRVVVTPDLAPVIEALPPDDEPPEGCLERLKPIKVNHMKALIWKNFLGLVRNFG